MVLTFIAAALAFVSFGLTLWQWEVARRFPLHRRVKNTVDAPDVTLLKPLKGCDSETEACLRSWFEQDYTGSVQILMGVASPQDPVCAVAKRLIAAYPGVQAELVICPEAVGANAKVSTLVHLRHRAAHEILVISDADVRAPQDLLRNIVVPLEEAGSGLVNCFYTLANPATAAMRWEAVAINADFWSQVLQSRSLKPLDYALGAVMAFPRAAVDKIGGFSSLADYLADDYHLGREIAALGLRIVLSPVVVECRSHAMGWRDVWVHQLRWARTIRVCQPFPFFFSILANATLWPILWLAVSPSGVTLGFVSLLLGVRVFSACSNQRRLTRHCPGWSALWLVPLKDLLGTLVWALAFVGNRITWRGHSYRILPDGRLSQLD